MKVKCMPLIVLVMMSADLFAARGSVFNLTSPTTLDLHTLNFTIKHRFYGDFTDDPFQNFFGLDAGANVQLGLRFQPLQHLELYTSYTRMRKEKTLGLSYAYAPRSLPLTAQVDLEYFSFEDLFLEETTRSNIMALLSLQNRPLADRVTITLNAGYDGYFERLVTGFGLTCTLLKDWWLFDQVALVGEWYPAPDRKNIDADLIGNYGDTDAAAAGIRMDTYGHRFLLLITNSDELHARHLSRGIAGDTYWRIGFNIERRLSL
ncbi:hypothetical protein JXO52_02195 [bacterium]|nr:hypothetical protein [bacterium]